MASKTFRPPVADKVGKAPLSGGPSREQILAGRLRGTQDTGPAAGVTEGGSLERIHGVLVFTDPVPPGHIDEWIEAVREERLREILE